MVQDRTLTSVYADLNAPFAHKQRDGAGRMKFDYITARMVMNRLDEVVGPENWEDDYVLLDASKGVVKCILTVLGTTKAGIGYPNAQEGDKNVDKEPVKSAESDALKRAAVKFGVGRYLYKDGTANVSDDDEGDVEHPAVQAATAIVNNRAPVAAVAQNGTNARVASVRDDDTIPDYTPSGPDAPTVAQMKSLYTIAKGRANHSPSQVAYESRQRFGGRRPEQLTRREASELATVYTNWNGK